MKVLKYGEGYLKTCTCENCKSELEYTPKDIQHTTEVAEHLINAYTSSDVDNEPIVRVEYVVCPVCGTMVRLFSAPIFTGYNKRKW